MHYIYLLFHPLCWHPYVCIYIYYLLICRESPEMCCLDQPWPCDWWTKFEGRHDAHHDQRFHGPEHQWDELQRCGSVIPAWYVGMTTCVATMDFSFRPHHKLASFKRSKRSRISTNNLNKQYGNYQCHISPKLAGWISPAESYLFSQRCDVKTMATTRVKWPPKCGF